MSHYKPYPTYKDSEVEWLGRVPEHWAVCKLSFRYSIELGKMLDEKRLTKTSLVPYLRNQDVQWGSINTQDLPEMDIHPEELERYTIRDGDLLVCEGGDVGRAAIWRGESAAFGYQKALHRLRHRSVGADTAEFFYFSLLTAKQRGVFEESDSKATIAHLPAEKFRQYRFAFPSLSEQRCIAAHLDRETARIDALIEKKTRFIELLREKTLSLVGQAFECEESRWIRLQHVCDVVSRSVGGEEEKSYVRLGLYNRGRGIFKKEETDAEDMGDSEFFWVEPGDLILSGQFAWEGAVALADVEHGSCVVSHRYPVIRGRAGEVLTEYLFAFFLSHYGDFLLNDCSRGSAGRNRPLNIISLLKWKIPVPPMELQKEVAALVRYRRELLQKVEISINLLKERRSALITAAVTGQIDLREAV